MFFEVMEEMISLGILGVVIGMGVGMGIGRILIFGFIIGLICLEMILIMFNCG